MIKVAPISPMDSGVLKLIDALDQYQLSMYPPASNHLDPADRLCADNVYFVGARKNDRLIGIGAVKVVEHDCRYGEMKRVYVCKSMRGKGISTQMMENLEQYLIARRIRIARLETGIYQPEAIGLYEKLGYRRRSSFGDYPADDPLSVFMEKELY